MEEQKLMSQNECPRSRSTFYTRGSFYDFYSRAICLGALYRRLISRPNSFFLHLLLVQPLLYYGDDEFHVERGVGVTRIRVADVIRRISEKV